MSWKILPTCMLCKPHSSSHTNNGTQSSRTPAHHARETARGLDRVSKELLSYLMSSGASANICSGEDSLATAEVNTLRYQHCPPGHGQQQNAPSPTDPTGWLSDWTPVTEQQGCGLSWWGAQADPELMPFWSPRPRGFVSWPAMLSQNWKYFPILPGFFSLHPPHHPPNPKNCVILTESSVDLKAWKNLVQSPIACLTSSFHIWPNGITRLKADWGLPWWSSG